MDKIIILLYLISTISAFFTALIEKEALLTRNIKPHYLVSIIFALAAVPVFLIYNNYWYSNPLLLFSFAFYITVSLAYLEILPYRFSFNHFGLQFLLVIIFSTVAKAGRANVIYIGFTFLLIYLLCLFLIRVLLNKSAGRLQQGKHIMELGRILSGILILVLGLVIANNSFRFLEKISRFFF